MTEQISGLVMLGAGGHARVLQELLSEEGFALAGYIAPSEEQCALVDVRWLGSDDVLRDLDPTHVELVNGIGSVEAVSVRRMAYDAATNLGYTFRSVIDRSASVRRSAALGRGVQVLPGAVVGSDVALGDDVIVNSGAIVEHGSVVGAHAHIAPGAVLSGSVTIGDSTHVGLGARVIQRVTIGSDCTIGAGAVVIRDVPDRSLALGVPAVTRRIAGGPRGGGNVDD